jgi:hypothetical protein
MLFFARDKYYYIYLSTQLVVVRAARNKNCVMLCYNIFSMFSSISLLFTGKEKLAAKNIKRQKYWGQNLLFVPPSV